MTQRWVFDGSKWSKEDQTPLEKGGANTNYEDKIAFMWSINSPTYEKEGPWALYKDAKEAATAGYQRPVKTAPKGETLDMWHFKLVRTGFTMPGQVDDQFVNDAFDASKAAEAGRTSDPGTGGYYNNERDFKMADGTTVKVPKYAMKNGDLNAYILTQEMIDRGDAVEMNDAGKAEWKDGKYTLEFGRKLNTGDAEHDVEFTDLGKTYYTGVATFDNTQIRHAVSDLIEFKFRR
jgi:Ethylbenzene dehydrogenase